MKFSAFLPAVLLATTHVHGYLKPEDESQVFEQLDGIPTPWILKENEHVDPNHPFKLRIHLRNLNMESFQQKVLDISTPSHPSYGKHMSREEVNRYLAPPSQSFDSVQQWLRNHEVGNVTIQNDWFILESTIGRVEKLLDTSYRVYENTETGQLTLRTLSYNLPISLHPYIDIVAPTIKFSIPSVHRSTLVDWPLENIETNKAEILNGNFAAVCNRTITLDCLKDLYNFRNFSVPSSANNKFALAGFLEEYAQHNDLQNFLEAYVPTASGADFSTVLVNGGLNTQQNTVNTPLNMGEANLDMQYAFLAYPVPTTYISTGGRPPETSNMEVDNEPYLEFLTYLLNSSETYQTISISYGDSEWSVPRSYARTVCDLFSQLSARGVSVLVSSGDSGSGSNCSETLPNSLRYTPAFPASCPFVTSVGATYQIEPEVAVPFSGGGFSDYFPRPAYQDPTVTAYLETANPAFKEFYNISGRAYPDVSAQGVNFHVFIRGSIVLESGTSASAPVMAAMVSLLNGDLIQRGMSPLGFLNPWLYSDGKMGFTDIVSGKGSGCPQVEGSGFPAVEGWDPVTGFGTPDFMRMREIASDTN
ncbi:Tripeptidyl-peptidase sed3 [Golovinomyces cichoracearum]|uniref:tripeptidyl-peptidase II n=1 Tax=Golovinomyces cichoracearum TaxID=62708 RepID=A0A420IMG2_9PEZI|nr:Tripeptidyl-peptidase sed3 [Golovinomyces cichoracearum]